MERDFATSTYQPADHLQYARLPYGPAEYFDETISIPVLHAFPFIFSFLLQLSLGGFVSFLTGKRGGKGKTKVSSTVSRSRLGSFGVLTMA